MINERMKNLDMAIEDLEGTVARLDSRLQPILKPVYLGNEPGEEEPTTSSSVMADSILSFSDRVTRVQRAVDLIHERLEL